jgi:hypothetical protein
MIKVDWHQAAALNAPAVTAIASSGSRERGGIALQSG